MKYGQTLINTIIKVLENNALHAYWDVKECHRFDDMEYCEIRFTDADSCEYAFVISGDTVHLQVTAYENPIKWIGCAKATSRDGLLVWMGYILEKAFNYVMNV